MSAAANRRRGHDCERAVAAYLRANGFPDACTTRAKLGHDGATAPGDIDFAPGICLEVKDVAASAWPSWRAQCVAEAGGRIPIVVRRTRGVTDVGRWEAQVPWRAISDGAMASNTGDGDFVRCARTGLMWVRTDLATVVAWLRADATIEEQTA